MQRIRIEHRTTYRFGTRVNLGPHRFLLRPREGHDVRIESSRLEVHPAHRVRWHRDIYGNSVGTLHFLEPSDLLWIASEVNIQHFDEQPLDFLFASTAVDFPFPYDPEESRDLVPYLTPSYPSDRGTLGEWVSRTWQPGARVQTFTLLDALNRRISTGFSYARRDDPGVQSPGETLARRQGSCRDFASLFIEACRSLGLASRFASGYLHCPGSEPAVPGATHAWAEVYLPGAGWKGFDSTTGEMTGTNHIAAAVSRHPSGVPPVSGSFFGPSGLCPLMEVDVRVTAL